MNIIREEVDALNSVLRVKIDKADYSEKIEKTLKDYRKKAAIKGFRPGHAPASLINKLYYKPALVDEVNKLVSESLTKYLADEKLNILGEPLPSEKQEAIDWETAEDFEFVFDLGHTPDFELNLSKRDKIPYYTIKIDDKLREIYVNSYRRRYGEYKPAEVADEKGLIKATLNELNADETPRADGIFVENASISVALVADESEKTKLIGAKVGDVIVLDATKAFPNATDRAALLHTTKDKLTNVNPSFQATVTEVMTFENAELNQDFFNKAFGEGNVTSEEEFIKRVEAEIANNLSRESDYRFLIDLKDRLIEKFKLELPREFLIRWLVAVNEGKHTREQIESEYPMFEKDLKWQLIRNKVVNEQGLTISDEEVRAFAMDFARNQFASYGMSQLPDEYLAGYADNILKKEEEKRRIQDRLLEDKAVAWLKENVKLDTKEVTTDEFNKL
jgi:trigger factor